MLYVSRLVNPNSVGIADTDDGSEEIVSLLRLASIVNMNGVDIKGTIMRRRSGVFGNPSVLSGVAVHQCEMYCTPAQAKANILFHTDVKLWRGVITSIRWRSSEIDKPVIIRLSDFGVACAGCILNDNPAVGQHKITLVLDNFVEVGAYTFYPQSARQKLTIDGIGVKFDLREVTRGLAAKLVYDSVMMNADDRIAACESIIDVDERKNTMLKGWGLMRF